MSEQTPPSIKSLFVECMRRDDPQARRSYLDDACGDQAVKDEVLALLEAHGVQDGFLERSFDGLNVTSAMPTVTDMTGEMIGPYKLLQRIGEGGFGVVYMAQQTEPVRRKVALKVIKPGMDTKEVIARFEAERQALALMDHPNIARVLDGGTTEHGRPYFVMELVHGVSITEFCDAKRLAVRERLELFSTVCRAVQHAHQKGIIHRDLKPSNVMITISDDKPMARIIDFGVSKALNEQLTENTLFTAYGQIIGTPMYMSPEQAQFSAHDVDTRSDVYSLGVLLYELLTGTTPFDRETLQKSGFDEMWRIIREVDPPQPSARVSTMESRALSTVSERRRIDADKLSHSLRGELDWIVARALEKDRARRYESASAFAADVQRYLNDEPVEASPPSTSYRFKKFVRRHRSQFVTAGTVVVALLTVTTVLSIAVLRNRQQQRNLEVDVQRSLTSARAAIDSGDLNVARQHSARAMALTSQDVKVSRGLAERLEQLQSELDNRYASRKRFERFQELSQSAQEMMDVDPKGDGDKIAEEALRVFDVLDDKHWVKKLETSYLTSGQQAELKEDVYELLVSLADYWGRNFASDPESIRKGLSLLERAAEFHRPSAAFYYVRSECHKRLGNKEQETADRELYKSTEARTAREHYLNGQMAAWRGDLDAAIEAYERALRIQPDHFKSLRFLAYRLLSTKRYEEAAQVYRACLVLRPEDNSSLRNRAFSLIQLEQLDEAEELARRAVELAPESEHNWSTLIWALVELGRFDQALAQSREALKVHPGSAVIYDRLGATLRRQGQLEEAVIAHRRAVGLDPELAFAYTRLGLALADSGEWKDATVAYQEAIAKHRKATRVDPDLAIAHYNLGNALKELERPREAIVEYRKAIDVDPGYAPAHHNLGVALKKLGKPTEALAALRESIKLDPAAAIAHSDLGAFLGENGETHEALAILRKAIKLDPQFAPAHNNLGFALNKQGKRNEAVAAWRKAIELDPKFAMPHVNLGNAFYELGKSQEAIAEFRKAIEVEPKSVAAHVSLGNAFYKLGKSQEAIAEFRRAIEADPKNAIPHFNLGNALRRQGKLNEAISAHRRATELDPKYANAYNNLGQVLFTVGRLDEAIVAWRKHMELAPDSPRTLSNIGFALLSQGRMDEALTEYRKAIELDPKYATAHNNLGDVLEKQGRLDEALTEYRKAIELDPRFALPRINLASVLKKKGELKGCVAVYSKAIELDPNNSHYPNSFAWFLATVRNPDYRDPRKAVTLAKRAIDLAPNDANCWNTLGVAQYRAGSYDEAIISLKKSIELSKGGTAIDFLFLAMSEWKLEHKKQAENWYQKAIDLMEKNRSSNEELLRFRMEAEELMKTGDASAGNENEFDNE